MYICKNCGQTYSDPVKFCGKCGSDSFEISQQGGYQQSAYGASYSNPTPAYTYAAPTPTPAGRNKAPAIVGMILGILALLLGLIAVIMATDALKFVPDYHSPQAISQADRLQTTYFEYLGNISVFMVPSIIVGLIMSFKRSAIRAMSIIGRTTSFISIGLWTIAFSIIASI